MIVLLVATQLVSSSFTFHKKKCNHTKKVSYTLGKAVCDCPKKAEQKSCCSSKSKKDESKTNVESICCEFEKTSLHVDDFYDVDTVSPPISLVAKFPNEEEVNSYVSADKQCLFAVYRPPPDKFHGSQLRVWIQSFLI